MTDGRSKNWVGVWYPEDETHVLALEKLIVNGYRFAGILHDKDEYTEAECADGQHTPGELKKPHWHIVITFANQRTVNPIAKELGIAPNYLQLCHDRDDALRYLVHAGWPDKFQYDPSEAFGPLGASIPQTTEKEDEETKVLRLLDLLETMPRPCSYKRFLMAACNAQLYAELRRMGVGAMRLLDEHNAMQKDWGKAYE